MRKRRAAATGRRRRKVAARGIRAQGRATPGGGPAGTLDVVALAKKQRLADLLAKMQSRKSLPSGQRRELAELSAELGGAATVSCQVQSGPLGPVAVVPAGHWLAASTDEQLAEAAGVDVRTVRWWKGQADWPGGRRGPYVLRGDLPAWIRARLAGGASRETTELSEVRRQLVSERTAKLRTEREVMEGRFLRAESVWEAWRASWAKVRAIIQAADRRHPGVADLVGRDLDQAERELESLRRGATGPARASEGTRHV